MTIPYDTDARYRHLQLARLLAKSSDVPPKLDDPALQAELDALDALERAEREGGDLAQLSAEASARIEARRADDARRERLRTTPGAVASDPPAPLRLAYSAPHDDEVAVKPPAAPVEKPEE